MSADRSSEVAQFREWAGRYNWRQPELAQLASRPDSELAEAIAGAQQWISGRRLSWNIVAANYLLDRRYRS
jgi:hypothetical protein